MSYTYLLEQGAESSAECFSDIPASVLSRLNPTAGASCFSANETESCQGSPSGTTCEPSTENRGGGALMSSAEDSRARTSRGLEVRLALTANEADYGQRSSDWFARFDPASSSWRTSQRCLITGWTEFSETFPPHGMMRNGRLYPHVPWVSHTCDSECSLWPTPTASMDGRGFGIPLHERTGRYKRSTVSRVHALVHAHGWRIHPNFTEALMGYPTDHTEIAPLETA